MSTTLKVRTLTISQRSAQTVSQVSSLLGLEDTKLLSAALIEAAAEGVHRNAAFASHVRALYGDMAEATKPKRPVQKPQMHVDLVPLRRIEGREIDPALPLDPYFLHELYGSHQLRAALSRYGKQKLVEAAELIQQQNPNAGPKNKSRATAATLIDYIVEHVAGSGH
jgi:hypothetical protein